MKPLKLLLLFIVTSITLTSCVVNELPNDSYVDDPFLLDEYISSYDLWYIDYNRTQGNGDVEFLSKAFTVSFLNGTMYANNNITDIGQTGNGFGIVVGNYDIYGATLETSHTLDGRYDFDVVQLSSDEIRIDDLSQNVSYYLIGYQRNNFDYDKLFYDNIEYFLQEYIAWERIDAVGGAPNSFDEEHFLQFTPEDDVTFFSSHDIFGTDIDNIKWNYVGGYEVANVSGEDDLKILTLNYSSGNTKRFELSVISDEMIQLYHISSKTTYTFSGRGFVQYLRKEKNIVRNSNRKRTKVQRKTVDKDI